MPSTNDFNRDQARQEAFDNDRERIDRFTDRAANSVHRPGIVERLRAGVIPATIGVMYDVPPVVVDTGQTEKKMTEAADLLEEIHQKIVNLMFESCRNPNMHPELANSLIWLNAKLEGK